MKDLIVCLERNGVMQTVERFSGKNASDSQFSYSEDYLKKADAVQRPAILSSRLFQR